MSRNERLPLMIVLSAMAVLLAFGCAKEQKQANLEVIDHEYTIRKESEDSNVWVLNAKGNIQNSGEVDVKNVTVTGYCRTCGEQIVNGQWFVSDYEKMTHQKDVISYLAAGAREDFSFEEIAFYPAPPGVKAPTSVPEDETIEIVIESYEVVQE